MLERVIHLKKGNLIDLNSVTFITKLFSVSDFFSSFGFFSTCSALLSFNNSVSDDGGQELHGTDGIVVARNDIVDFIGSQLVSTTPMTGIPSLRAS